MRDSLLWRLLGAQLLVMVIAVAISGVLITDLASHTFMTIMSRYNIEPVAVEAEFQASARQALLVSGLVATAAAMLLGWVLARRLMRPLDRMMVLAEWIARGDYARRVDVRGPSEIVRLADALNRMAGGLERVEALRRDLVANVAHELRTPLSTLRGYLEALLDGLAPPSTDTLRSLHEEVLRLVRLVEDLWQLSQFDARALRPRAVDLDLPALAHGLESVYGAAFAARGMTLRVLAGPRLPLVRADADLVGLALRNLLDNALRYAPAGAEVAVIIVIENGSATVEVRNTGEGIAAGDLPHIFERFYRGEGSRSRETGGAGIGLSIVQEIAHAHGGGTGASSANGVTTVWFSLPVQPAGAQPSREVAPSRTVAAGRRSA